jgi:hypothetical protein
MNQLSMPHYSSKLTNNASNLSQQGKGHQSAERLTEHNQKSVSQHHHQSLTLEGLVNQHQQLSQQ